MGDGIRRCIAYLGEKPSSAVKQEVGNSRIRRDSVSFSICLLNERKVLQRYARVI